MKRNWAHGAARGGLAVLTALVALLCVSSAALALPEGRAYEKVTPAFKGGYGASEILGVEPNGEAVAYASAGVFAGEPNDEGVDDYEAVRSPSGWSTAPLMPPAGFAPSPSLRGFSPSLGASLWELNPGTRNHNALSPEVQFAAHTAGAPDTEAGFQSIGPLLTPITGEKLGGEISIYGFSSDLCHVVIGSVIPLLAQAVGSEEELYDISKGCHGELPGLNLVASSGAGGPLPGVCKPDFVAGAGASKFNGMSADGSEIFFQEPIKATNAECFKGVEYGKQLFVRLGGTTTLEVSKPLGECPGGEVPCGGAFSRPFARFWGASEDGSRVFFTTTARLDPSGDLDSANDLYMAKIGCQGEASGCEASQRVMTGLVQVSHDSHAGQAAEVQGVMGIAPDGSRVYFVARGVLSEAANQQGLVAVGGADNLYVYDSVTGQTVFVGDLCSGPELSGAVADVACPDDLQGEESSSPRNDTLLWRQFPRSFAQTAGDGRFLVFSTYARLITAGPEADADDAQDVYRYDAQTGLLQRVSVGEAGYAANGNGNDGEQVVGQIDNEGFRAGDARIQESVTQASVGQEERSGVRRAVSEDGSRIVFVAAEPLSPKATNGLLNVYEWDNGVVSLVSCGCATEPDSQPMVTPSGRDVFFKTSAGLVTGDTDGAPDIYDARLGGGFAPPEAPPERCEGDACQGPLATPAPVLVPGSAVQAPGENAPASAVVKAKAKPKPKRKVKKKRVRVKRPAKARAKKTSKGRK